MTAPKRAAQLAAHSQDNDGVAEEPQAAASPTAEKADPLHFVAPPSTAKNPWAPEIAQLEHRRSLVRLISEDERGVIRQRKEGKLTVRERIAALVDAGSLKEFGTTASPKVTMDPNTGQLTSFMRANNIVGKATIEGRPVIISADDFTIRGGHADGAVHRKTQFGEQMAREYRIPLVRMVDVREPIDSCFEGGSSDNCPTLSV